MAHGDVKFHIKDKCEICGTSNLHEYINLGDVFLTNTYVRPGEPPAERVPAAVNYCSDCSNSQISHIVDPKFLFSIYPYHSSVSEKFTEHCFKMAEYINNLFGGRKIKCLDIASNDGCLLSQFKKYGWDILGVEPATNLANFAINKGIPTLNNFWCQSTADKVLSIIGKVDVVTATNVFPHVEDSHEFLSGVSKMIDDGIFIMEGSYTRDMIRDGKFDLIFHEHIYYYLVKPLIKLFEIHDMEIFDVQSFDIHCGSLRVLAKKKGNNKFDINKNVISNYLKEEEEMGLYSLNTYYSLEKKANLRRIEFKKILDNVKKEGKRVVGYGASSKANIFVNYCGLDNKDVAYVIDDTPEKHNTLFPGTNIMILPYDTIRKDKPDYMWISAWNFEDEIVGKIKRKGGFEGKYILSLPLPKIIGL